MSGQRDALLEWGVSHRDNLGYAQAVLLGCFAVLDDVILASRVEDSALLTRLHEVRHEVQDFLEHVAWVTPTPQTPLPGVPELGEEAGTPGGGQ